MRITDVRLSPVWPLRDTGRTSPHVIVQIHTDEGVVGIGEMSDVRDIAAVPDLGDLADRLTDALRDSDPMDYAHGRAAAQYYGVSIRAGIEIALYDLRGRILGVPLTYLLGGLHRDRVPVCYPVFSQADEDGVQSNLRLVDEMLDRGFNAIRFNVWPANIEMDELFARTVRKTHGDGIVFKSFDMGGHFPWNDAIAAINRFEKYDFHLAESPCRQLKDTARVRNRVGMRISEHVNTMDRARQAIELDAVDVFNITVPHAGLDHARMLFKIAEAFDIKTLIGTTQELSIGTAAQAALGASVPNLDFHCDLSGQLYEEDVVVAPLEYEDSHLIVPDGPGVGLTLDEEMLEKLYGPLHLGWQGES